LKCRYSYPRSACRQRYPNHRKCSVKLSPKPRTDLGSKSSPRTSRFPNSIIKKLRQKTSASRPATAFNYTQSRAHRQAFIDNSAGIFFTNPPTQNPLGQSSKTSAEKLQQLSPRASPSTPFSASGSLTRQNFSAGLNSNHRVRRNTSASPTKIPALLHHHASLPHRPTTMTVATRDIGPLSQHPARLGSRRTGWWVDPFTAIAQPAPWRRYLADRLIGGLVHTFRQRTSMGRVGIEPTT
jgi:hypothetical protein